MIVRQLVGDVALAMLVAIPAGSLMRPEAVPHARAATLATPGHQSAVALASAADRQVGLIR